MLQLDPLNLTYLSSNLRDVWSRWHSDPDCWTRRSKRRRCVSSTEPSCSVRRNWSGANKLNRRYNYTHTYSSHLLLAWGSVCAAKWVQNPGTSSPACLLCHRHTCVYTECRSYICLTLVWTHQSCLCVCVVRLKRRSQWKSVEGRRFLCCQTSQKRIN